MKLHQIKPNPDNPRRIAPEALERLKESIRRDPEFMRLRPIIVDESGTILGGNQRHAAIAALGMTEIPDDWVRRADDLTAEQRRRFVIVDNGPEGMSGEWDLELLAADWGDVELEELGLDIGELEDIEVLDSAGKLDGGNYGDVRSDRVPVNILGIGGMVAREVMERTRTKLVDHGADASADNGELIQGIFSAWCDR
jgi:hypothetical protein